MSMDDLQLFLSLVDEHPEEADFVGPQDQRIIASAESALGLVFPPTYRRFLSKLGAGDVAGQEFYGVTGDDFECSSVPNGIWLTLKGREEWGLARSMIVIGFDGGVDYYVIDTSKADDCTGEAPIEIWRPGTTTAGDQLERAATDFGEFALRLATLGLDSPGV